MKKLLRFTPVFATLALLMTSCWPGQTYDKNGISFDYPGGWSITDDEFTNNRGYLSLKKEGSDPAATITFGWMVSDANIGADMMIHNIFKEMQATETFTEFESEPAVDVPYGEYPARAVAYTATIDGVACVGNIWVFSAEGRVVNVALREGADKANIAEFKKIKDSFTLK
jgi:hypothetical protein